MFEDAQALAKLENRTMSELMREALRRYQHEREWQQIRTFGKMAAEIADVQSEEDVVNLVRQVRHEIAQEKAAGTVASAQVNP